MQDDCFEAYCLLKYEENKNATKNQSSKLKKIQSFCFKRVTLKVLGRNLSFGKSL